MKHFYTMSFLIMLFTSAHVEAGWGDFLEDLKKSISNASDETTEQTLSLDSNTIVAGLKEALMVGSKRAISEISQDGGYLNNADIHIPLPPSVEKAGDLMRQFGLAELADQFENSLNSAAEAAAPEATNIVIDAIKKMSIEDARKILNGPDNAATTYFREHTTESLKAMFKPKIETSLNNVGSTRYYNQLNDKVSSIPVVGQSLDLDLPDYVTNEALEGLFTMLAVEEKKIRDNPAERTTELLKKVFQ